MAISPESSSADRHSVDFRAPPPSPIASGRRSSFTNEDVLTEFLQNSLRVPDLILPDRIFPRQKSIQNPPKIDFCSLNSPQNSSVAEILDSIARIGCFQIINHGIKREFVESILTAGAGIFTLPPEKKKAVSRSSEKPYGFEEFLGEDEREMSEEFVWCRDQNLKLEMEGIWPHEYSNFSLKMEELLSEIEKLAGEIILALKKNTATKPRCENGVTQEQDLAGSLCYLYKHFFNSPVDQWDNSLGYDVIRMLIRGSDCSHSLGLHFCYGSSEFHVYYKKGWVSFCPETDAIVITIGDQIQAWSGGQYKHVIGRPIFKGELGDQDYCISMAFLYSPPRIGNSLETMSKEKTISIGQQAILALIMALVFQLLVYYVFKQ
ncbi:jasmonate-induced oxygenase 1 [Diospyros lotus]|uniref:jasmonate-induced oxygenase 1 n=1 Tax=Diospyros lotus TaxID=55363 RepID=UPI00224C9C8B|nr:jasmonate-induced oxygenase 1 [Diospyros lotus]